MMMLMLIMMMLMMKINEDVNKSNRLAPQGWRLLKQTQTESIGWHWDGNIHTETGWYCDAPRIRSRTFTTYEWRSRWSNVIFTKYAERGCVHQDGTRMLKTLHGGPHGIAEGHPSQDLKKTHNKKRTYFDHLRLTSHWNPQIHNQMPILPNIIWLGFQDVPLETVKDLSPSSFLMIF